MGHLECKAIYMDPNLGELRPAVINISLLVSCEDVNFLPIAFPVTMIYQQPH